MSRPKPTVLLEYVDKNSYSCEQILEADAIWAVFYKGEPFNLRSGNAIHNHPAPKYKKTSFSNKGHAINLAKKLNRLFKSDNFSVVKLRIGDVIYP
jgi:hypothetical protein